MFLLIPHIVRESLLTDENTEAIYSGTGQSVELMRRDPAKAAAAAARAAALSAAAPVAEQDTSAARAASAMVGAMARDASPLPAPGVAANAALASGVAPALASPVGATTTGAVTPVSMRVVPPSSTQTVGSTFQVVVQVSNAHDLYSVPLQMQFDPKVLALVDVDGGGLMNKDGQPAALVHRDGGDGSVTISESRPPQAKGVDGEGTLCTLTFKAVGAGDTQVALVRIGARDSKQNNLPTVGSQATVHVK